MDHVGLRGRGGGWGVEGNGRMSRGVRVMHGREGQLERLGRERAVGEQQGMGVGWGRLRAGGRGGGEGERASR